MQITQTTVVRLFGLGHVYHLADISTDDRVVTLCDRIFPLTHVREATRADGMHVCHACRIVDHERAAAVEAIQG